MKLSLKKINYLRRKRDYIIKLFKKADFDKPGFLKLNQLKYLFKNKLNTYFQMNKLINYMNFLLLLMMV